jgi:hypothetical protein
MITKDFRTYTMIFLRQGKSLRDHGGGLVTWRNANTSGITSITCWLPDRRRHLSR